MRVDDGCPEAGGRRGALGVIQGARGGGIGEPGAVRHGVQGLDPVAVGRRWMEVEVGIRRDVADGRHQGAPTVDLVVRDGGVVGRGRPGQIDAGGAGGRRGQVGDIAGRVAVGDRRCGRRRCIAEPRVIARGIDRLQLVGIGGGRAHRRVCVARHGPDRREQDVVSVDLVVRDPDVVGRRDPGQIDPSGEKAVASSDDGSEGAAVSGVVTLAVLLNPERLPAPSTAFSL